MLVGNIFQHFFRISQLAFCGLVHVGMSKTLNGTFGGVYRKFKLKYNISIIIAVVVEKIWYQEKTLKFCSPFTCTPIKAFTYA